MKRLLSVATLLALPLLVIASSTAWGQWSGANAERQEAASDIAATSAVVNETEPVAVPQPSAKAMDYYRGGNWLWVLNQVWAILLPGALAFSGASAWLRSLAQRLGRGWFLTIGFYTVLYLTIVFLIELPLAFLEGFVRQHAYGLSNQSLARWLGHSLISLGVDLAVGFALTWVPYLLLAQSPRRWWLYTAILTVPFLFTAVLVEPIWIDPLFNKFGPMHDKALERSILSLAERAGIEGSRVFEVDKSADTKAVNAYVTGVFNTKRIVLWDTLIAKLHEPELLVVMAHEMGHYVLGHVVRSILLSTIVALPGLFLVDRLGRRLIARFPDRLGCDRLSDVASMPLLLMLIEVATLVLSPFALAYSRYQEHEADRFALDLTHANHSGALAFVKLQEENLSNPRPGLLYKLFRSTHPSIGDRIDFCNSYHPWRPDGPPEPEKGREKSPISELRENRDPHIMR